MTKEEHNRILITTAAFETDFSVDWLVELLNIRASSVLSVLESAIQNGWIIKKGPGLFCFIDLNKKQQLIEKLNPAEKQSLYANIIDILKKEICNNDDKYFIISKYLLQIDNDIESSRWLITAANEYIKAYRSSEALFCYAKALNDLMKIRSQESDCLFAETAIKYSKISGARRDTKEILFFLEEAITRAYKWNRKDLQVLLEMQKAKNEWLSLNYQKALEHFEQGWRLAKGLEDPKIQYSVNLFATFFFFWEGRFNEVVRNYEKLTLDVEKYPLGSFSLLSTIMAGNCYTLTGQVAEGIGMMNSIHQYCKERGDSFLAAHASYTLGATMADIRRLDEALQYLTCALDETNNEPSWVTIRAFVVLAFINLLIGDKEKCIYYIQEHLRHSRIINVAVRPYSYWMELCWAVKEKQLPPIDALDLTKELDNIIKSNNIFWKGIGYRYLALLERKENMNHKKIIDLLNQSINYLSESGHHIELANTQNELARQYQYMGYMDKARKYAEEAYQLLLPYGPNLFPDDLRIMIRKSLFKESILEEVLTLSKSIIMAKDEKDVAQRIILASNKITAAERGALFMADQNDPNKIILRASKNLTAIDVDNPKFQHSLSLIKQVIKKGKSHIQRSPITKNIQSCICVPMILNSNVVGVLYHDNRFLRKAFRKKDLKLLEHFATLAAFILDNSKIENINKRLNEEKEYLKQFQNTNLYQLLGRSEAMKNIKLQIREVADTDTTVLIQGETGVGKELIARAIHNQSNRRGEPFISVNCGALPESLISSELFGHEKGAFTNAVCRRIGRFELADGGTLFLDEIGELSTEVQAMLLRVLETKQFERVGGSETIHSNFRLIVATNVNLEQKAKENKFRSDLFYRLNVFPIYVPPLRERKEDIPELVDFFVKFYATKLKKPILEVRDKEMQTLLDYPWPGNVRELENIIERAMISSSQQYLVIPDLITGHLSVDYRNHNLSLKENERRHIIWVLQKTKWKIRGPGGAAELLDIHPSTLAFRMKKLGIRKSEF